jgi:predicted nucleotidyltransferase
VLLLRHEPSGIDLDVSLGALPFEEDMIRRARRHRVGSIRIPLPTPEDLIVMKAIAHRPRDVGDIESILEANPRIDEERVLGLVREFAAVLEAPELATDLERLLNNRRQRRRRKPRAPGSAPRSGRSRQR